MTNTNSNPNSVTGTTTITVANTLQPLVVVDTPCRVVEVQTDNTNTGIATINGIRYPAGAVRTVYIKNAKNIQVTSTVVGDIIRYDIQW
jgi:hypothetical protein